MQDDSQKLAVVIGVGNEFRGDDAVGVRAARAVREKGLPGVTVLEMARTPLDLLDAWVGAELAIVLDAIVSGASTGTVHRLEGDDADLVLLQNRTASGHGLGVAEAVSLARALGRMPRRLVFLGIEAAAFEHGSPMSAEVEAALPLLLERTLAELS